MENFPNIVNISGSCFDYVSPFSSGIWNLKSDETIVGYSIFRLHLQIILMFLIPNLLHFFLKRFHLPRLTSEILTGMILGATIMDRIVDKEKNVLFPPFPNQVIVSLVKTSYIIYVFLASVRMDPRLIKSIGWKCVVLAIVLVVIPRSMVQTIETTFDKNNEPDISFQTTLKYFGSTFFNVVTTTQFVGVSGLLMQQRIINSRLGHMALASAMLSELIKIAINFMMGVQTTAKSISARSAIQSVVFGCTLVVFIVSIFRAIMLFFIRLTQQGKPIKDTYTIVVFVLVFAVSIVGDSSGTSYIFFPIIVGLVVPSGSPLAASLQDKLETLTSGLLVPILTVQTASKFDLVNFIISFPILAHFQLTLIAYVLKLAATFLTIILLRMPIKDAAALTLILNIKSVVDMGTIMSFVPIEIEDIGINSTIFSVFLLSACVPPLIKMIYDPEKDYIGHKRKSIQHTPNGEEIQMVVCAHRREDALAAIKLLEFSNPTKDKPLGVFGLCLEEMVGSDTPLIINHQFKQEASSERPSRLQPAIDIFRYFKAHNKRVAQVQIFTAISPLLQMHEDICWLAFDRAASFIVLPFHKKWNIKGKVVSTSNELRALNNSVLERAPCSVGILIDRGKTGHLSSIFITSSINRVAVLFVGGPDDREALAYALRMAGSERVELTVVHFTSPTDVTSDKWEKVLNVESLRDMRHEMSRSNNIRYMEESVRDGAETAAIIKEVEGSYDLIMVGRRHEDNPTVLLGFSEWLELPELGPIGDMLASSEEISSGASVLVVQQQIMKQSHSSILN